MRRVGFRAEKPGLRRNFRDFCPGEKVRTFRPLGPAFGLPLTADHGRRFSRTSAAARSRRPAGPRWAACAQFRRLAVRSQRSRLVRRVGAAADPDLRPLAGDDGRSGDRDCRRRHGLDADARPHPGDPGVGHRRERRVHGRRQRARDVGVERHRRPGRQRHRHRRLLLEVLGHAGSGRPGPGGRSARDDDRRAGSAGRSITAPASSTSASPQTASTSASSARSSTRRTTASSWWRPRATAGTPIPSTRGATRRVLSVAGTDENDQLADWSTRGSWVQLAAPDCEMVMDPNAGPAYGCGSSFGPPAVSGIAGLLLSISPGLTANQLADALRVTAHPVQRDRRRARRRMGRRQLPGPRPGHAASADDDRDSRGGADVVAAGPAHRRCRPQAGGDPPPARRRGRSSSSWSAGRSPPTAG